MYRHPTHLRQCLDPAGEARDHEDVQDHVEHERGDGERHQHPVGSGWGLFWGGGWWWGWVAGVWGGGDC